MCIVVTRCMNLLLFRMFLIFGYNQFYKFLTVDLKIEVKLLVNVFVKKYLHINDVDMSK